MDIAVMETKSKAYISQTRSLSISFISLSFSRESLGWLVGQSIGWSLVGGWLIGCWLVGWLVSWLVG